jgi:predicted TIM-barrel enzyme
MKRFTRTELLARFHDMAKKKEPIIGGGAGTGISAKWAEASPW